MYCFEFSSSIIAFMLILKFFDVTGNTFGSRIQFFNGDTITAYTSHDLTIAENVVNNPGFDLTRTTMIYIHGWNQSPYSPGSQEIVNAYISNGRYNILVLDWSQAASGAFTIVTFRVDEIGREVALFIGRMNTMKGLQFAKIHLVGHSLGAHLAGSAGKYTAKWSGQTKYIDRITGLDPANLYLDILNWRYARFVDIIHTDAGRFGTIQNSGHVDFWPNRIGFGVQPGCPILRTTRRQFTCCHTRSVYLWAESVWRENNASFLAVNRVNRNIIIQMGNNCPTADVQGVYDLTTNGAPLFSKS